MSNGTLRDVAASRPSPAKPSQPQPSSARGVVVRSTELATAGPSPPRTSKSTRGPTGRNEKDNRREEVLVPPDVRRSLEALRYESVMARATALLVARPTTITDARWDDVTARNPLVDRFSHGFSRIGIENQAPLLFEADQQHILRIVKDFNNLLLDGDLLVRRTKENPSGMSGRGGTTDLDASLGGRSAVDEAEHGSRGASRGDPGGGDASSGLPAVLLPGANRPSVHIPIGVYAPGGGVTIFTAVVENELRHFHQMKARLELAHLDSSDINESPLLHLYDPTELTRQLTGVPPHAALSMTFRIAPWRSLFEHWLEAAQEEKRPEKPLQVTSFPSAPSAVPSSSSSMTHEDLRRRQQHKAAVDVAWLSTRPARSVAKNVDPIAHLQVFLQCVMRAMNYDALTSLSTVESGALADVDRRQSGVTGDTLGAAAAEFAQRSKLDAKRAKVQMFARLVTPPKQIPHFITTIAVLYALVEHVEELFGPQAAPLIKALLAELIPLVVVLPNPALAALPASSSGVETSTHRQQRQAHCHFSTSLAGSRSLQPLASLHPLGPHASAAELASHYVRSTHAQEVTQYVPLLQLARMRTKDKATLSDRHDKINLRAVRAVMRRTMMSVFHQWSQLTRRHKQLRAAMRSLLVASSDAEVTRRAVMRWRFHSKRERFGGDAQRAVQRLSTSRGLASKAQPPSVASSSSGGGGGPVDAVDSPRSKTSLAAGDTALPPLTSWTAVVVAPPHSTSDAEQAHRDPSAQRDPTAHLSSGPASPLSIFSPGSPLVSPGTLTDMLSRRPQDCAGADATSSSLLLPHGLEGGTSLLRGATWYPPGVGWSPAPSPRNANNVSVNSRSDRSVAAGGGAPSFSSKDAKTPFERHRRAQLLVTTLREHMTVRNRLIAEFDFSQKQQMDLRIQELEENIATYRETTLSIGNCFRDVLDLLFPLVPSPMHQQIAEDLSIECTPHVVGLLSTPSLPHTFSITPLQPLDMAPFARAGKAAQRSLQRVDAAATRGIAKRSDTTAPSDSGLPSQQRSQSHLPGIHNNNIAQRRLPEVAPPVFPTAPPPSLLRNDTRQPRFPPPNALASEVEGQSSRHSVCGDTLQAAEDLQSAAIRQRMERIFVWIGHLSTLDLAAGGGKLSHFLNRCCTSTSSLTLSVVSRTSHLLPIIRLTLLILAPPYLTHHQLEDVFTAELLRGATNNRGRGVDESGDGQDDREPTSPTLRSSALTRSHSSSSRFRRDSSLANVVEFIASRRSGALGVSNFPDDPFSVDFVDQTPPLLLHSATTTPGMPPSGVESAFANAVASSHRSPAVGTLSVHLPELRDEQDALERRRSSRVLLGGGGGNDINPPSQTETPRTAVLPPQPGSGSPLQQQQQQLQSAPQSVGQFPLLEPPRKSRRERSVSVIVDTAHSASQGAADLSPGDSQPFGAADPATGGSPTTPAGPMVSAAAFATVRGARNSIEGRSPLTDDRRTRHRRFSQMSADSGVGGVLAQQQQPQHPNHEGAPAGTAVYSEFGRTRSLSNMLQAATLRAAQTDELKSSESFSKRYQRRRSSLMQSASLKVPIALEMQRRKSVDVFGNKNVNSILSMESAAMQLVSEHRKGFVGPPKSDVAVELVKEVLSDGARRDEIDALSAAEQLRLLREEEEQISAINEEMDTADREKELHEVLKGVLDCTDATSMAHLVLRVANRVFKRDNVATDDLMEGGAASAAASPTHRAMSTMSRLFLGASASPASSPTSPTTSASTPQRVFRVLPKVLARHLVLKERNWRPLILAFLYYTQVGPCCFAFRILYAGLESRAQKPLDELSADERRDLLLGKKKAKPYHIACNDVPQHDLVPPVVTALGMHQLLAKRRQRKKKLRLDIEEANALVLYNDVVRDISLRAFYGVGLSSTATQVYEAFCAASPDVADATVILPAFFASKLRIVFGPESSFWKPVTSVRVIQSIREMEDIITTLAPLARITAEELCDKLLHTLDDADLFFMSLSSPEVEDAFTACLPELSVVFALYASGDPLSPTISYSGWLAINQPLVDVSYSITMAESIYEVISRRLLNRNALKELLLKGPTALSLFQLNQALRKPPAQSRDADCPHVHLIGLDLDSFCDALSVVISMKFPNPFVPLEQKVVPFVQTLLVPFVGAKSKEMRRMLYPNEGLTKQERKRGKLVTVEDLSTDLQQKIKGIMEKKKRAADYRLVADSHHTTSPQPHWLE